MPKRNHTACKLDKHGKLLPHSPLSCRISHFFYTRSTKNKGTFSVKKMFLFILWLGIIVLAGSYYFRAGIPLSQYPDLIQYTIEALGFWGPIAYIVLYTIRPLILFPGSVLTGMSGLLFGPFLGILYTAIGANLSAVFAFLLARYFGGSFVSKTDSGWMSKYNKKLEENGFVTILIMRLIYLPFDLVNFGAGLTSIKLRDFVAGTILGTLPGSLTFVLLGASFTDPRNLLIAAATLVFGIVLSNFLKKRHKDLAAASDQLEERKEN